MQLDDLEIATTFDLELYHSPISSSLIFLFKKIFFLNLPNRVSSLINIMLAEEESQKFILPSEKNTHLTIPGLLIWSQKGWDLPHHLTNPERMGTARLELCQLSRITQAQKNDGESLQHLQQAELESWCGRRTSGKQPDKMEKIEFASAVQQACSFILSKFHWNFGALVSNAAAETDNDR